MAAVTSPARHAALLATSASNREQRQSKAHRAMEWPKPSSARSSVTMSASVRVRMQRPSCTSSQLGSITTTRFTRTRHSDIVHPVSSSQLTEARDRVRSFGGYNTRTFFPPSLSARRETGVIMHCQIRGLISQDFALFVKLRGRFDTRCSRFHLLDRRCGELLLVDRFGVAGDLAQAGVTGDGRNLVRGAACLSQPASGGLAEPVCAAAVQAGGSALVAEPIAKAGSAVGLALICDEKGQVVGSRLGDDRGERRVHWDRQLDTGLKLPDLQCSIADMLPAHAHDIRTPLTSVEQEGERQAGTRTDHMPCLELLDFTLGPAVIAV